MMRKAKTVSEARSRRFVMVRDGAGGEICGGPDISSGECSKGGAPRVCGKDGLQRFSGRGRIFSAAPPGLVPLLRLNPRLTALRQAQGRLWAAFFRRFAAVAGKQTSRTHTYRRTYYLQI